ncbi:SIS domain-containing protein [Roseateles sp.]|jgi:glucosamine--fructose-6-phosphate aminotransferase (isomerizing)|uniref:SIS domain-containing protein n=1 Tax=Roseateles sp. TaxID=1971397 RepID=UPI0037C533DD
MYEEALSAPAVVARQLAADHTAYAALGESLRQQPPSSLLTVARGSSDHAAHYLAYLVMARLGRLVTSLPMSLVTLYQSRLVCDGLVSLAFSQSGQSPDLVAPTRFLRDGGARTVAFVNAEGSPLAEAAQHVFPLHAGAERSVAATKSYIAQLVAGARVVAAWQGDDDLLAALQQLPQVLEQAAALRWDVAVDVLREADRLFVIGRGTGLPIAMEAALKFKETCGIQAEAFSGAEVKHGPMALVEEGYPMLVFAPRGPAQAGLLALADEMRGRGARVLLAAPAGTPGAELPLVCSGSEDLDPIAVVQSFYPMVEALSRARGNNPDQPRHLAKVTKTH